MKSVFFVCTWATMSIFIFFSTVLISLLNYYNIYFEVKIDAIEIKKEMFHALKWTFFEYPSISWGGILPIFFKTATFRKNCNFLLFFFIIFLLRCTNFGKNYTFLEKNWDVFLLLLSIDPDFFQTCLILGFNFLCFFFLLEFK